jgi:hypothetical protein
MKVLLQGVYVYMCECEDTALAFVLFIIQRVSLHILKVEPRLNIKRRPLLQ